MLLQQSSFILFCIICAFVPPTTEFSDANAKFYCRIYYAEEFHKMREIIMESMEEDFVRSLSHCVNWQARGGKSGAVFYATEGEGLQPLSLSCMPPNQIHN